VKLGSSSFEIQKTAFCQRAVHEISAIKDTYLEPKIAAFKAIERDRESTSSASESLFSTLVRLACVNWSSACFNRVSNTSKDRPHRRSSSSSQLRVRMGNTRNVNTQRVSASAMRCRRPFATCVAGISSPTWC
jgi:hypothetical protein